ncbi:MAG TPA: aminoglycoside adenylyltransferase domain-containing protein [Acidimicrobiales bacterium]|nr:aminoglycoside adenylyltransferase domain-containing protein [Acidimicrobiales bacterium]
MLPAAAADPLGSFVRAAGRAVPERLAAVYVVGGVALGDFSARQSNLDVVAVFDPPLAETETAAVRPAERALARAGRPASVWYAGWDLIADGPAGDPGGWPELETPLTRALLQEEAIAYMGPDWPVVAYDDGAYRNWCRRTLAELATGEHGMMVMRRGVTPLVLEAARLALGATTGRVYSKSEAGDSAISLVPHHFRRILQDAVGYRHGATTSMYWGPFERKYDARQLIRELVRAVGEA